MFISLFLPNGGVTFRLNAVGNTTSNTDNANDGYAAYYSQNLNDHKPMLNIYDIAHQSNCSTTSNQSELIFFLSLVIGSVVCVVSRRTPQVKPKGSSPTRF